VIADTYVDRAFGSGAVKITPGHDPNDYEVGQRHGLPIVSVMNEDATMSAEAGPYAGKSREEARAALVERFTHDGTLVRTEPHRSAVGTCYRCQTIVEPMISTQWFVRVRELADETLRAVDEGRTRIVPQHWEKTYRTWMENIRPWCISRQLWWGHRIPAWYCDACPRTIVSRTDVTECPGCGGSVRQDEDVLDTWFSSGLWPFSTLGWPDRTQDLERFYPTSVLVTAFDIIFFWVARMMMMGLRFMGDVPFRDVYIHALVRDEYGQKMSKSKGNVIDPLDIVGQYGADAFRFTLVAFAAMGRDIRLSEERIAGYRNFVNKLWNAARYAALKREGRAVSCTLPDAQRDLTARWIRSRLAAATRDVREALDAYRFNDAASRLYSFVWHELCDWYIELSKVVLDRDDEALRDEAAQTLTAVLERTLRLLHPIMPFVTEEVWQSLPAGGREGDTIMLAEYPAFEPSWIDAEADAEIGAVVEVVRAVRNVRAEMGIKPNQDLDVYVSAGPTGDVISRQRDFVRRLARAGSISVGEKPPPGCAVALAAGAEVSVPIAAHVDLAAEAARLRKEIAKLEGEVARFEKKLANEAFVAKAPEEIVEAERAKRDAAAGERDTLRRSLERIEAVGGAR
jgi:valyl-tRNA synthetase